MDLFHYTFLKNHGYLDKFRAALNAPALSLPYLNALLKTFNNKHKLIRFIVPDDRGKMTLFYKDTLNYILNNKILIEELNRYLDEWDAKDAEKQATYTDTNDANDDEDMQKVSDKLIWNDNYKEVDESKKMKGRKIYITESQFDTLMESYNFVDPDKVKIVAKYLDENFVRGGIACMGEDGYPTTVEIVAIKGTDGKLVKNMNAKQLFYMLQDKFQHIYTDKDKRDKFLKQIIKDWYAHKISKEGLLSVNKY